MHSVLCFFLCLGVWIRVDILKQAWQNKDASTLAFRIFI